MVFATSGRAQMAKRSVVHFVHHPGCSLLLVWCRSIAEFFFWKPRYLVSDVFHGSFLHETSIMTPAIFHSKIMIMDHGYIIIHWIGRGINTYSFWKLKLANIDHDPAFFQYVQSFERKRGPDLVTKCPKYIWKTMKKILSLKLSIPILLLEQGRRCGLMLFSNKTTCRFERPDLERSTLNSKSFDFSGFSSSENWSCATI